MILFISNYYCAIIVPSSLEQDIRSGDYFKRARIWYATKYITPLSQRSMLLIFLGIIGVMLLGIILNVISLFPVVKQVRYSINSNIFQSSANIISADQIANNSLRSIADIMIRNYVIHRESYDYDQLKSQFAFIQNNSTRLVFRKFYNYMSIDNSLSPVLKYQKYIRRSVNILSTEYSNDNQVTVVFSTLAKNSGGEISENMVWQASLNYEIDQINLNLSDNSRFNFAITDYRVKLLQDKINK